MDETSSFLLGWGVLGVVTVTAVAAGVRMWLQERRQSKESHLFFRQAQASLECYPDARAQIEEYERGRESVFQELLAEGRVHAGEADLEPGAPIESSWMRCLVSRHQKQTLKVLLLRRAVANVPRWIHLSQEMNAKYRLYRHQLLSEQMWVRFSALHDDLQQELDFLKFEAECLEASWGERILRDALVLYRLQQQKEVQQRQQELEAKQSALQQQKKQQLEQQQQEALARKADKQAERLLKAEAASGSTKKKKGSKS